MKKGNKIQSIYKKFKKVLQNIYKLFEGVEKKAQDIVEVTKLFEKSNCKKMANAILKTKASKLLPQIKILQNKTFKFLSTSHRGFICSMCDAKNYSYYNYFANEIVMSHAFCKKMVESSLSYYINRYIHLPKISRLYG